MSSHRRTFQCFNAIGGESPHKPSLNFRRHTSRLPRISRHGMVAHHEPLEECYICTECRQAQALEAREAQVSPLYHAQTYHHHHPYQYVLRRPTRPEEPPVEHSGQDRHIHHHRYNKRVVLVKNSDPSFRKTIILHRRTLRSLGLFLEEVSELMQYHIRKVYTLEGRKIDSVQSLLQCPSVLVCVGREPSHPTIVENFRKTSDDKLPQLSVRSRSTGCTEGFEGKINVNQGLNTRKNVIHPKLESSNRSAGQSLSSDKSTDSPEHVDPCPHTGEAMINDDIEKRVRINNDGSLSMEMKVRFRLLNDETLHWSTEVRKTTGKTCEYPQGHNNFFLEQASDEICSESENISAGVADEAYITKRYQKHMEEPHCPHCCTHCQEYDIWKNLIPGTQGASRHIRSSSSSASSHTMVCRKTTVESRQTMSGSSEEHTEQVVERETSFEQTVEEVETVEYCTIRSECMEQSSTVDNCENDQVSVKITQVSEEEERTGSALSASSQVLASLKEDQDEEDDDIPPSASRAGSCSQNSKPEEEETIRRTVLSTGSSMQHLCPNPPSRASSASRHSGKSKKSEKSVSPMADGPDESYEGPPSMKKMLLNMRKLKREDLVPCQ
ncbi:retinitis pigmentosa 1-like 1 protein [Centroberyx affinis]|uniref:retinitis pigmentosa 1-like 1 protein n=1 Tax=Centroberyx affinis TaxID=166261 RepID=UPI003A5BCA3E